MFLKFVRTWSAVFLLTMLVFFASSGDISHVGVYVGKGRFVHAPNSGGTVRLDDIDGPYWRDHFAYGKRLLD